MFQIPCTQQIRPAAFKLRYLSVQISLFFCLNSLVLWYYVRLKFGSSFSDIPWRKMFQNLQQQYLTLFISLVHENCLN